MVFSSIIFLFYFLPAVLLCYFLVPRKYLRLRNAVLILFSLFFYFYGEPKGIFVMIVSIVINYLGAIFIVKCSGRKKKLFLILTIAMNLAILCYYKYSTFFLDNINQLFQSHIHVPEVVMPIGISFFTFQGMSYAFDVYYRTVEVQKNPFHVGLYISLFPQLVAGPIVRYQTVAEEISCRNTSLEDVSAGIRQFIFGLAKKVLLANPLGLVATEIFSQNIATMAPLTAWMGIIAFTFQIFFDFAGYSDMAIGLGKVFGFHFPKNFDFPYISRSITEFWRRWHMSLGQWFRDYVYIPLGGNRKGLPRQLVNILIVWLLTGFWHGASWNFILWGLYFAAILVLEKIFLLRWLDKVWQPIQHIYALFLIVIGWVIFQFPTFHEIFAYLTAMFGLNEGGDSINLAVYFWKEYRFEWIFAAICSLPIFSALWNKYRGSQKFMLITNLFTIILLILSVLSLVGSTFNPFIYFRF